MADEWTRAADAWHPDDVTEVRGDPRPTHWRPAHRPPARWYRRSDFAQGPA